MSQNKPAWLQRLLGRKDAKSKLPQREQGEKQEQLPDVPTPPPAAASLAQITQPAVQATQAEVGWKQPVETLLASKPRDGVALVAEQQYVPADWSVGDGILDLYEVKHIHDGGGMGLVYRVHHRAWNVDMAVKSPRPEFFAAQAHKENFVRECLAWIALGLHAHIVCCYYVRMLGGIPRVFAEYVEGGSEAMIVIAMINLMVHRLSPG